MPFMAIDQRGTTWHDLGLHPRKALLDRLDRRHATKMYTDRPSGPPVHIGYVIGGLWLRLYVVEPWEKPA